MFGFLGGIYIEFFFYLLRVYLFIIKEIIRKMIKEVRKVIFLFLNEIFEIYEKVLK